MQVGTYLLPNFLKIKYKVWKLKIKLFQFKFIGNKAQAQFLTKL